jgi:hypothetical protein
MDQPKPPTNSSILDELKQSLAAADRCIQLARKEGKRIDAALQALSARGIEAEQQVLEHAKERRKQLECLEERAVQSPPVSLEVAISRPLKQQLAATVEGPTVRLIGQDALWQAGRRGPGDEGPTPGKRNLAK